MTAKLSIPTTEEEKELFLSVAKSQKLTTQGLFSVMFKYFSTVYSEFTNDEYELIDQAIEINKSEFFKKSKQAVLSMAKRVIESKECEHKSDKTIRNSYRSANARVREIVDELKAYNAIAEHWYDKKFISKKAVIDYAKERKQKGELTFAAGRQVVNRFLDANKAEIDAHHKEHGLDMGHNFKVYHHLKETKKESRNEQ